MRLFIAEKPSVGREISKYLAGRAKRGDGYIDHGEDVVTWAFGHILEQASPGDYDERYQRWRAEDLPIVPDTWKLLITKSSEKQFHTIAELLQRADTIVNAGDPDREGQLLIDEILEYTGNTKPVKRLLLNALDEKSVKAALANLRDNADFYNLKQSALARSRADWLIGMNLSRAYTLAQRRQGHKVTFPIGRVKTPTLALVVRRERELENFKPLDYYVLKVLYEHPKGSFWATWKPRDEQVGVDAAGHLLKREIAVALARTLAESKEGRIESCSRSKKKEAPRLPLSLSALQVAAGKAYGYDPQQVLDAAQSLYEKKLTTYPRSDCDYLPENQYADRGAVLAHLKTYADPLITSWAEGADVTIRSKAWNDKKITAHHAIIPTTVSAAQANLTTAERRIYFLIARSYIAQFYGDYIYEQTKIAVRQADELFTAAGHVVVDMGWKALFVNKDSTAKHGEADEAEEADSTSAAALPRVTKGDTVTVDNTAIDKKQTKPPARFTSSTLLQAMKEIHKYVRNEELKKQLKAVSGIGTEATRATIIGELIKRRFMTEQGKKKVLRPTELGYMLVDALPEEMLYPDETAVWEERLADMSEGKDSLSAFLTDQVAFLRRLIEKVNGEKDRDRLRENEVRVVTGISTEADNDKEGPETSRVRCPKCGTGYMVERHGKFGTFWGCSQFPTCRHTTSTACGNGGAPDTSYETAKQELQAAHDGEESKVRLENAKEKGYLCPRCKEGYFIPVGEGHRQRWICSNTAACRTTCADVDGVPSIYAPRK